MGVAFGTLGYIDRNCPPIIPPTTPVVPSSAVNLFQKSDIFVHNNLSKFGVVAITLQRDGDIFLTKGAPGSTPFKSTNRHNMTFIEHSRDYIIDVSNYQFNLTLQRPKKGDKIIEVQDGKQYTYKVLPFNGEPVYRFSGTYRTSYRVHTKLDKEEDV